MVRDFVKWDDQPTTLQGFAESAVRAYRIAMTPPTLPVALVADFHVQEDPIAPGAKLRIPKLTLPQPPQGDSASVAETARLLVQAENPVIIAERAAHSQAGMENSGAAGRNAAGAGDRPARAHEFSVAASAQPIAAKFRVARAGGRRSGT